MKLYGKLHKLQRKFSDFTVQEYLWLWRPICWITRSHKDNTWHDWNYGRTYCTACDKTFSKDPWRIKRDEEKKRGSH